MSDLAPEGASSDRVCVGVIVGAQGVRGWLRVKSFTEDPELLDSYGPLSSEDGTRHWTLTVQGRAKGVVVCSIDGITDRTVAETLKGQMLYLSRQALPTLDNEDEFYHSDLIGLPAFFADGREVGTVTALYDFGAGDVMELQGRDGGTVVIPFTKAVVPVIDLPGKRLEVVVVPGLLEEPIRPGTSGARKRSISTRLESGETAPSEPPTDEDWPEEDW